MIDKRYDFEVFPDDIIVVKASGVLKREDREQLENELTERFGRKVVVLNSGQDIALIIRKRG